MLAIQESSESPIEDAGETPALPGIKEDVGETPVLPGKNPPLPLPGGESFAGKTPAPPGEE